MRAQRTALTTLQPVTLDQVKAHLRVDADDDDATISFLVTAATEEIERHSSIALLSQAIAIACEPAAIVDLPIGPVQSGIAAAVEEIDPDDGTTTATTHPFWLETGHFPRLHFGSTTPTNRIRISYTAGFGVDWNDVPHDARQAILDHIARLYEHRGETDERARPGLSPHAARIAQRFRGVRV